MLFKIMERAARAPHALPCSRVAFFPSHSGPPQQAQLFCTCDGATVFAEAALFNFVPQLFIPLGDVSVLANWLFKIYI